MEKTITISFDEYQELKKENEMLKSGLLEKKAYVIEGSYYWFDSWYKIYTDNETIDLLTKRCDKLREISNHLLKSIKDLKTVNYFNINKRIEKSLQESKNIAGE